MIGHSIAKTQQTTKLAHIGVRARVEKDTVFNNLGHVIDLDLLHTSFQQLDARKAVGCDGVSKSEYGVGLEDQG